MKMIGLFAYRLDSNRIKGIDQYCSQYGVARSKFVRPSGTPIHPDGQNKSGICNSIITLVNEAYAWRVEIATLSLAMTGWLEDCFVRPSATIGTTGRTDNLTNYIPNTCFNFTYPVLLTGILAPDLRMAIWLSFS